MTADEIRDRAALEIVFYGHTKIPRRKDVPRAAALIADARAKMATAPKRDYSAALRLVLSGDEILASLYTGAPLKNLSYYLAGPVAAAGSLLAELRGDE